MTWSRRWVAWLALAALTASAFGAWAFNERRFAASLGRARELMDERRFPEARRILAGLHSARPADAEVGYRLGVCEHAEGDVPEALPPGPPGSAWPARGRSSATWGGSARPRPSWNRS